MIDLLWCLIRRLIASSLRLLNFTPLHCLLVHAILGIRLRPKISDERADSQDRMDQQDV